MAVIRPSSDLRNRYGEISEFCNKHQEPVFITKNGSGDLVVMSNAEYERLSGKHELYRMLDAGLADAAGEKMNVKNGVDAVGSRRRLVDPLGEKQSRPETISKGLVHTPENHAHQRNRNLLGSQPGQDAHAGVQRCGAKRFKKQQDLLIHQMFPSSIQHLQP